MSDECKLMATVFATMSLCFFILGSIVAQIPPEQRKAFDVYIPLVIGLFVGIPLGAFLTQQLVKRLFQ